MVRFPRLAGLTVHSAPLRQLPVPVLPEPGLDVTIFFGPGILTDGEFRDRCCNTTILSFFVSLELAYFPVRNRGSPH